MARIGDPSFIEPINKLLNKSRHSELRKSAAFALGSIEGETAYLFVSQNIPMHKDPDLSRELLMAAGRKGNVRAIHQLSFYLKPTFPTPIQDGACSGLGQAFAMLEERVQDEGTLKLLAELLGNPDVALSAAFALSRWQGDPNLIPVQALSGALPQMVDSAPRALLSRALGRVRTPAAREALIQAFKKAKEKNEKIEALKGLGNQEVSEPVLAVIASGLTDSFRHIQITAIQSAGKLRTGAAPLTGQIDSLFMGSGSEWVRSEALIALVAIAPDLARQRIQEQIKKSTGLVLGSMVYSFALLGTPPDLALIGDFLSSPHTDLARRALEGLLQLRPEQFTPGMKELIRKTILRKDAGLVATASDIISRNKWSSHLDALKTTYGTFSMDDAAEIRSAIIRTVGELGDETQVPFLEGALRDRYRVVSEAASRALKRINGKDYPFPLSGAGGAPVPSADQLTSAVKKTAVIQTSRGDFTIRFNEDTPVTAYYFLKEAPNQKGRTFHRVVPNFVAQGGDPRGDGFGGPGYSVRDEISLRPHERGSVGIATAGKDTGGCQFFVDTAPNPHLLGRYTNFARVTSGIEVLDRMEPNDTILKIRVY
ncbi:MAG: peptidylprolyl isomerase [Deltaproteobacteria bacterium]|nr:peptidylprolyl isomerase [Deltaproteobacteria bacterium]